MMIGGGAVLLKALMKNPDIRGRYDQMIFSIPIIGNLRRQLMLTEFTRTLGLLIGAGILIVDAIEIVRGSLKSPVYNKAIKEVSR